MGKIKSILKLESSLLLILSFILLMPLSISVIYSESSQNYIHFIYPALISFGLGAFLYLITIKHKIKLDLAGAMAACAISWIVISLIGAVPFIIGMKVDFIDAFYESISGYTASGLTVFIGLDDLEKSIVFYRSMIQWIGGLGILTFFLLVTTNSEGEIWKLYGAESHKIGLSRPVPNIYRTIKYLWVIYILYTTMQTLILKLLGLSFFESLIHSFTTISTGGFTNHDSSIAYFSQAGYANYILIEYVFILFMFLGGMNFLIHYKIIKGDIFAFFKDTESKTYLKIILGAFLLVLIARIAKEGTNFGGIEENIRKSLFQVTAIATTSGFSTENINSSYFPLVARQVILVLMLIGGCVGSTSGGFKVLRVVILQKLLRREIKKATLPSSAIVPVSIDRAMLEKDEVLRVSGLLFGWTILILAGSFVAGLSSELEAFEAFSGMVSAVNNVGPMYVNEEKIKAAGSVIKITYIIGMLSGRLELLPIMVLFTKKTWR